MVVCDCQFHIVKTQTTRRGSNLLIITDVKSKSAVIGLPEHMVKSDGNASFKKCTGDMFEVIHLLFGKLFTTPTEDKTYPMQLFLSEQLDLFPKKNERKCTQLRS